MCFMERKWGNIKMVSTDKKWSFFSSLLLTTWSVVECKICIKWANNCFEEYSRILFDFHFPFLLGVPLSSGSPCEDPSVSSICFSLLLKSYISEGFFFLVSGYWFMSICIFLLLLNNITWGAPNSFILNGCMVFHAMDLPYSIQLF